EASIDGMEVGDQLLAGQITLPAGAELEDDPETLILSAVAQISEEALEAELGETEAEEPEVPVAGEEGAEGAEAAEGADSES
ncbi:MAG: 50S ribosomal protein L25, partial [Propionibacterium sp.]